jgi:hypothetical protein
MRQVVRQSPEFICERVGPDMVSQAEHLAELQSPSLADRAEKEPLEPFTVGVAKPRPCQPNKDLPFHVPGSEHPRVDFQEHDPRFDSVGRSARNAVDQVVKIR